MEWIKSRWKMQIIGMFDSTEQICPTDSASGVLRNGERIIFVATIEEILWEYERLQGRWRGWGGGDAWQQGFGSTSVWIWQARVNIWVLAAGKNACWQLWKLWVFWCGLPENAQENWLGWFQGWLSNAFLREGSVINSISHCYCGPLSNITAPQLDPRSFLPLSAPSPFPPPLLSTPAPPIVDDPGWWRLHQGLYQMHYS